jgi:hypothetical protein
MNEQILELAHQAGFISKKHNGDDWRWGYIDPELKEKLEKFAELIVQECCDIFVELRTRPADLAVLDVKKQFGVEE